MANISLVAKAIAIVAIAALTWKYPFIGAITLTITYGLVLVARKR